MPLKLARAHALHGLIPVAPFPLPLALAFAAFTAALTACSGASTTLLAAPDAGADASADTDAGADAAGATTDGAGSINPGDAGCATGVTPRSGTALTTTGAVTGAKSGATWSWKGIPYAAPPVGALRFRPPRPASCWSGERVATAYGPKCPQVDPATAQVVGDEDCLTLNVWANEGLSAAPVLVFLHGGGNAAGSASDPLYDGQKLAAATGAVVVTLEYRIGALGFFAHAALNAESEHGVSGNYGLLDQIAALAWVRDNAAAFGGAPDHVMVFGESAGGVDTMALLVSPLAEGLFAAAGIESGGVYTTTLSEGIAATKPVVDGVGCGDATDVAACLRGKSAAQLAAVPAAIGPLETGMHFKPVIDGYVLPEGSLARVGRGAHNHVPVILGTNADETSRMVPAVTTDAQYQAAVRALYPVAAADALLALYPSSSYPSPRAALVRLTTDATWTCPARRIARALADHQSEPVFRYHFSWKAPGAAGAVTGATHGIELLHVFGNFDAVQGVTPASADLALSAQVQGYWGRLAQARDPNGPGAVSWPRYATSSDPYLEIDSDIASAAGLATASCDAMEALLK